MHVTVPSAEGGRIDAVFEKEQKRGARDADGATWPRHAVRLRTRFALINNQEVAGSASLLSPSIPLATAPIVLPPRPIESFHPVHRVTAPNPLRLFAVEARCFVPSHRFNPTALVCFAQSACLGAFHIITSFLTSTSSSLLYHLPISSFISRYLTHLSH